MNRQLDPLLWIAEPEVAELVDLEDAIDAQERMLALEAAGDALNMAKALGAYGDRNSMHALGSMAPGSGFVGFKTWVNTEHGAGTIYSLFDSETGALRAVIEAAVLSQLRTAAVSGVATKWLARADADEMALIGSGRQAMMQLAAVAAVRSLRSVRVYSPTPAKREDFAARAAAAFSFDVTAADSIEAACAGADVVTIVTRAREAFFPGSALAPGAHVNAVGAILRNTAEFYQDVFDRAGIVVVDSIVNVQAISSEFIERYERGPGDWSQVKALSALVAEAQARPTNVDITLFKAMGMGLADLAIAKLVYERALERGVGRDIPRMGRSAARWRTSRRQTDR